MRPLRLLLAVAGACLVGLTACIPQPVEWEEPAQVADGPIADSLRLELAPDGSPRLVPAFVPPAWPGDPAACAASRRAARTPSGQVYASWFSVRPDSSVRLVVARSDDGGATWRASVAADTTDVGTAGCARPAPYLSVDSLNGYVHLAYHLDAREGAGIFFAHSMDGGAMYHEPVPIVYGDRPSAAAVTSNADTVLVVYEDPNSRFPRLAVAVSHVQGHIFEARQPASDETGEARAPQAALRGGRVVIVWTASQRDGRWPRTVQRQGTLVH